MLQLPFSFLSTWSDCGLLAMRLVLGLIFVIHGWPKIRNLAATTNNFSAMGFKPGAFWGTLVALLEFFGGLAFFFGFFAQVLAAFFVIEFITIIVWRISKKHAFVGGYELDLLILAAVSLVFFSGAGALSLDRMLFGGF